MKKLILPTILLVFIGITGYAQVTTKVNKQKPKAPTKKTDVQLADLIGKVKQINQQCFKAQDKFGEIVQSEKENPQGAVENYLLSFDDRGNSTEKINYNADGSLYDKYTRNYDEKGNFIELNNFNMDPPTPDKETYKYNAIGKRIESISYGAFQVKVIYIYDEKGNIIEINDNDAISGTLNSKTKYKYDNNGNLIEYNFYNPDGSSHMKDIYVYDIEGNEIEKNSYFEGSFTGKQNNKYNSNGKIIETINFNSNGKVSGICKYDANGNKIEESGLNNINNKNTYRYDTYDRIIEENYYHSDGSLYEKKTFKYDEKGNKFEESGPNYSNASGIANDNYSYKYEYDQQGNWIKKIVFLNTIPQNIFIREITYF